MENTFADTAAGEPITADYIPELTKANPNDFGIYIITNDKIY